MVNIENLECLLLSRKQFKYSECFYLCNAIWKCELKMFTTMSGEDLVFTTSEREDKNEYRFTNKPLGSKSLKGGKQK